MIDKLFKALGMNDQDILEVKTGYKEIFKILLMIAGAGVIVAICVLLGIHWYLAYGLLILVAVFFLLAILTAWAQHIGQEELAVKEKVTFERSDGSTGSYVVYKTNGENK